MNNLTNKNFKFFIAIIACCLLALYSCKKDGETKPGPLVGIWQPKAPYNVKFYDATTGAEIRDPGFGYDISPQAITFNTDGSYYSGDTKGTYIYNSTTRVITAKLGTNEPNDLKVLTLDDDKLTLETSVVYGKFKILAAINYIKYKK